MSKVGDHCGPLYFGDIKGTRSRPCARSMDFDFHGSDTIRTHGLE